MSSFEERFSDGDPALVDEQSVLEGYRWIFTIVQAGMQAHLWADSQRPQFVDIVGRYKKWGGDNSDAFYQYAPIDPTKTYRVRARRADAVYYSLTVYGGPNDGRYSERIVGSASDRDIDDGPDGTIEIMLSPHEHPQPWIKLEPDAVCAITRDYLIEPGHEPAHGVADRVPRRRLRTAAHRRGAGREVPRRAHLDRGPGEDHAAGARRAERRSKRRTRCRRRRSAGRPATPRTRWAATSSPTTRRW